MSVADEAVLIDQIANALAHAQAAERDRCASIAESVIHDGTPGVIASASWITEQIFARGATEELPMDNPNVLVDLDAALRRLDELSDVAHMLWERIELEAAEDDDEPDTDYGIWLVLEKADIGWTCGYAYQPDEAQEWAIVAQGATPMQAVAALLRRIESTAKD
jgi:hypothetical protein